MFSKLKQYKDLRDQAKTMQNALAQESVTNDKAGIKIVMNGNMEVTSLSIPSDMTAEKIESALKDLFNDTIKKVQRIMAQKIQSMGGLPGIQ